MTTTAYAVVIGLYVLCGALTAVVASDENKAAGELAAPLESLLILAALWPVMFIARFFYLIARFFYLIARFFYFIARFFYRFVRKF